jgi:hypothetical protein
MERKRLLTLIIIQIIPLLAFPLNLLKDGFLAIPFLALIFALLGWGLLNGRGWALTLSILIQGMNVTIRLMMFLPNSIDNNGVWDFPYVLTSSFAILFSGWIMLRLDRPDIRAMIHA